MKLSVTQENLSRALASVSRVASNKTPLPILNNILLKTDKNRLLLAATNLDLAITEHVGAKVEVEGSITVPSRLMSEFISQLPKGNVELVLEGTKLQVKAGSYQSTIHGLAPDEFPALPDIKPAQKINLPAEEFKRAVTQTAPFASKDTTRPVLTGVFCHSFEGQLFLAATDGYRLAERSLGAHSGELTAIVPFGALNEAVRIIDENTEEISLWFDEAQVRIILKNTEITSRLIDDKFPDYRKLIPAKTDITAELSKEEFNRITKIASLFARESGGSITISADKNSLSVHSIASQLGENTSSTSAKVNTSGQVTLNSRYLLEALSSVDEDEVEFGFSGKLAPCVIKGEGKKTNYKHIIMPLKS